MPDQKLADFIKQRRQANVPDQSIQQELLSSGWPREQVLSALSQSPTTVNPPETPSGQGPTVATGATPIKSGGFGILTWIFITIVVVVILGVVSVYLTGAYMFNETKDHPALNVAREALQDDSLNLVDTDDGTGSDGYVRSEHKLLPGELKVYDAVERMFEKMPDPGSDAPAFLTDFIVHAKESLSEARQGRSTESSIIISRLYDSDTESVKKIAQKCIQRLI